jgi:predicted  nucleic acid-binding Zn-ribbon protein
LTNFQALKDIKQQMTQNEQRIKTLERLKDGASEAIRAATDQAIQAMNQENETLRLRVQQEEKTFSFFGWFAKLFVK